MTFLRGWLTALVVLAVLDFLWLGMIGREFYKARLAGLLLDRPIWVAAIVFYVVHAAGIAAFPLQLAGGSPMGAALYGAFFGLCVYAAYDLTNLATLRGWSLPLTLVDLAWGVAVTAVATLAATYASR
jgi:uncharacterized membrane protein